MPRTSLRIAGVDPSGDAELAQSLWGIQRAAYAVEAHLIGDDRIPVLHESVSDLQSAGVRWMAAFVDAELVGAVAWSESAEEVEIDRLFVAPRRHGRGFGRALILRVLDRASPRHTHVSTGRDNAPARGLYERLGFTHIDDVEVIEGLWISRYRS
ncbi:MAG: GNAT family N-acetyltransferase [Ornithinimicrobium sp.]